MYLFVCLCIWSFNQWSDLFVIAVHDLQSFGLDNVSNPTDVSSLTDLWFVSYVNILFARFSC